MIGSAGELMGLRMGEVFAPRVVFSAPEGDILEAPEQEGGFVDELMVFGPEFPSQSEAPMMYPGRAALALRSNGVAWARR